MFSRAGQICEHCLPASNVFDVLKLLLIAQIVAVGIFTSTTPAAAGNLELSAGITASDIGGGTQYGPALGLTTVKNYDSSNFLLRLSFEYNRKSGTGQVSDSSLSSGDVLYRGTADVHLHYLQAVLSLGYEIGGNKFNMTPYFGMGPALLLNQTVEPAGQTLDGAFEDYRGYSSFEFLALGGFKVRYSRLVLDIQFTQGLIDLANSCDSWDCTGTNGSALLNGNEKSQSLRLAFGIVF